MKVSLFLLALVAAVQATSSGESVDLCDAMSDAYGCPADQPYPINRGQEQRLECPVKGSKIMHWAKAAVYKPDTYKMYVGDEANPTTSFVPGQLHEVTIEVIKHRMMYRGILLYAKSGNQRVGSWELPVDEPQLFQNSASCSNAVMHTSAEHKPYKVILHWRAPTDASITSVTFECLLKYGDANTGEFYWPNSAPLSLTRGSVPATPATQWVRGEKGQSCSEVCAAKGKTCNANFLTTLDSPAKLRSEIGKHHVCKLPYVRGCDAIGATSSADNFCYYHSPAACTATQKTAQTPTCDAKSNDDADGFRFCPCGDCPTCTAPPATTAGNNNNPPPAATTRAPPQATTAPPGNACPRGELNCPCASESRCFSPNSCSGGKCVAPAPPAATTAAGPPPTDAEGSTVMQTTNAAAPLPTTTAPVYQTVIYEEKTECADALGTKGCKCKADNTCADGGQKLECYQGVCLLPDCNGDLDCSCKSGKCFAPYVCAIVDNGGGVCVEAPATDPPVTPASTVLFSALVGAVAALVALA